MVWIEYLQADRANKLSRIEELANGNGQLSITTNGVRRDITAETLDKLHLDVAEIERILAENGMPFDA